MTLGYDPDEATAHLLRCDKQLATMIRRVGPFALKTEKMASPFQSLFKAIVYQQLNGKAAGTIFQRVKDLFPDPQKPTPEDLLKLKDGPLRGAGLSQNKLLALRDLAAKTVDGTVPTLRKLRGMTDAEIVERLTTVRGVGVWTVEMLLMFRLGRPDVLPVADFGVRHGFRLTYDLPEMPDPKVLLKHGECWRPFRSVASWYMWRAVDWHKSAVPPVTKPSASRSAARRG
jgi:3-methyladenine DNA glycosylase/8-oxoguanine DNA glycosylase